MSSNQLDDNQLHETRPFSDPGSSSNKSGSETGENDATQELNQVLVSIIQRNNFA